MQLGLFIFHGCAFLRQFSKRCFDRLAVRKLMMRQREYSGCS
jgi:hypothetical protein